MTYHTALLWTFLFLSALIEPVSAAYYSFGSWYIYLVIIFIIMAISSCIGACIRYKRHQAMAEAVYAQGVSQHTFVHSNAAMSNQGYGHTEQPPYGGLVTEPPAYNSVTDQPNKDTDLPPAYDDACAYPSPHMSSAATATSGQQPPYPTQPTPYPTQSAPNPMPSAPSGTTYP